MVLRPGGALAWTEPPGDDGIGYVRAVGDDADRTLDQGPHIDAASLADDAEARVRWTRAGQVRTAPLP
jgi:hypothetical protein